ncbi:uncharacterized protein LOC117331722 isoform X2 [Pecten maximus]|uniref:uncharacterized protein LOC117331722 isoform X2 n=1 Tax=Pecten maximus TaxID=6579 RepID=UPI0014587645|nr:uncharacterized protein LOC117331722 isoform X2 [Pecten maximus]
MASKQSNDNGARPKTNFKSNIQNQECSKMETEKKERLENNQGQDKHVRLGTDLDNDSVPYAPQDTSLPGPTGETDSESDLLLVDLVVIYTKEDFDKVDTEFIPWLKKMARQCNIDARIYLYDDSVVLKRDNIFRKADDVLAKCMKILVYITENFMKDKSLTGIVEELICLTRFMDDTEINEHISKISQLANNMNRNLDLLHECVLRQKENAVMRVQTTAKKIRFTGLQANNNIIEFFDLEKNARLKERVAKNVITKAFMDREKQELVVNHRNKSSMSNENQCTTSGRHSYATSADGQHNISHQNQHAAHLEGGHQLPVDTQVVSNAKTSTPLEKQLNNEAVDIVCTTSTSTGFEVASNQSNQIWETKQPNPRQGNESQTVIGGVVTSISGSPASSNALEGNIAHSRNTAVSGLNNPEKNPETKPAHCSHIGETSENKDIKTHGAEGALPPEDVGDSDDIEEDQLESSKNKYKENKSTASKLTDSGYDSATGQEELSPTDESDRSGKDSGETSLDNTSLVNDSGNAALNSQKTESILSIDAKDSLNNESKVLEHTAARSVMAGNPAPKNFDGSHPVDSLDPSNLNNEKRFGSPQALFHLLTGTMDLIKFPG